MHRIRVLDPDRDIGIRVVIDLDTEPDIAPSHTAPTQKKAHIRSGYLLVRPHLVLVWERRAYAWG